MSYYIKTQSLHHHVFFTLHIGFYERAVHSFTAFLSSIQQNSLRLWDIEDIQCLYGTQYEILKTFNDLTPHIGFCKCAVLYFSHFLNSIQLNTSKLWSLENIQFIIPLQNHTTIKYEEFLSGNSEYKYMTT